MNRKHFYKAGSIKQANLCLPAKEAYIKFMTEWRFYVIDISLNTVSLISLCIKQMRSMMFGI